MDPSKCFVNEQIVVKNVTLILDDGKKYGVVNIIEALKKADEKGLDLVQISYPTNGEPPICKIMDFGKLRYEFSKQHGKKGHNEVTKEIKFHYNTAQHDLDIKNKKVIDFLNKKYRVFYKMELKGREKFLIKNAISKFEKCLEMFTELAEWKQPNITSEGISAMLIHRVMN
jgi:translation initiation factor IF-3